MLPSEITDAIHAFAAAEAYEREASILALIRTPEDWLNPELTYAQLRDAILKYGDQRYEEGIEAGRELEQTKGEGM